MGTQKNKMIAEFMGGKYKTQFFIPHNHIWLPIHGIVSNERLKYNSSWDWIMPVVEKINIMDDYKFTVIIKSMDVEIYDNITNKIVFESEMKWEADELINSLNEAVTEFIVWYNQQSQ